MMYVISLLIISIIIGGGSWSTETIAKQKTNDNISTINAAERSNLHDKAPSAVNNVYTNETLIFARDEYENCSLWAGIGECEANPEFMLKKCRRSCDILLTSTISNEAPFMKAQREWYDDLRDEYLDHSTPDNALRNEALFKMLFLHKMNELIEEYDKEEDEDYLNMVIESMYGLLNNDERLSFDKEVTLLHETFRAIGGEDFINPYNLMTYYLNIAEGTEHEYVSSTIVHSKPALFNKFSTSIDNDISLIYEKLTSKPHPELDNSWTWADLSDAKLFDVCDLIGYRNGAKSLLYQTHLHDILLQMAKECHVIQALWHVLPKEDGDWLNSRNRREELDYLISNVPVTDDERSDLRAYINTLLQEEVKEEEGIVQVVAFTMACVFAIALLVLTFGFIKSNHSRPTKKKKAMKPKHAEKKKESIYSHLLSFAHHVYAMLLDTLSKLCGMIWKTPSLLLAVVLSTFDSVADAIRSTANVSFGIIQQLFTRKCSILRRGIQCLVVIPRMISIGIGMLIRLPSKLIRQEMGTEHVSIDQPSNSSPRQAEAPQLVMSPSSAMSVLAVDEKEVNSLVEQNTIRKLDAVYDDSDNNLAEVSPLDTAPREEEVPFEIGIVNSSQVLTCETTEISISSFNQRSNTSMTLSTFELNENDPLLIFLRSQEACIKGSVDEFYIWLVKYENIESMMALKEAVSDDDYLNDTMRIGDRSYGVKGFKLKSFRYAILEYSDTKPVQQKSKASSLTSEPPEELVCPISLSLMTNDPVVAADGITYERASIEDWFKKSKAKISKAQENLKENPHSKSDQRVVNNGICSPVYGSKMDHLVLVPHIGTRNMARAYKTKKEEAQ